MLYISLYFYMYVKFIFQTTWKIKIQKYRYRENRSEETVALTNEHEGISRQIIGIITGETFDLKEVGRNHLQTCHIGGTAVTKRIRGVG